MLAVCIQKFINVQDVDDGAKLDVGLVDDVAKINVGTVEGPNETALLHQVKVK